jgi:hypothetical protein
MPGFRELPEAYIAIGGIFAPKEQKAPLAV